MPYKSNEEDLASHRRSYQRNKEKTLARHKLYRMANPEKFALYSKRWRERNREKSRQVVRESSKKRRSIPEIREKMNNSCAKWHQENPEYGREYRREWTKKRSIEYPLFRLKRNLSGVVRHAFKSKGIKKKSKCFSLVGCVGEKLKLYIEKKFEPGMTWDNYGKEWHIDHGIPLSWAKNEFELKSFCHFTNLSPMWASENIKKGNRWYR